MSFYTDQIKCYTGCTDAQVRCVEEWMREETGGCLDHLSADQFKRSARRNLRLVQEAEEIAADPLHPEHEMVAEMLGFMYHGEFSAA